YDVKQLVFTKIAIHVGNSVIFVSIENIVHIQSEAKCTFFKPKLGEEYNSWKELADFAFILECHRYIVRVSKNTYINVNCVKTYSKGNTCFLTMSDDSVIEIPRRKKSDVLEILRGK